MQTLLDLGKLFPFFILGVKDSLNLYIYSLVLGFLICIAVLRSRKIPYRVYALFSCLAFIGTRSYLLLEPNIDPLRILGVNTFIRWCYYVLATVIFFFGAAHFRDWVYLKKSESLEGLWLSPGDSLKRGSKRIYLRWIFCAVIFGLLLSLMSWISPENQDLFVGFLFLMNAGKYMTAYFSVVLYTIGYAFFFVTGILWFMMIDRIQFVRELLARFLSVEKVLISAALIAWSIGLGYLLIK